MTGPYSSDPSSPVRPLSPHLQIFRPILTMVMSVFHRLTGMGLYAGIALPIAWLLALASGPEHFALAQDLVQSWFGLVLAVVLSWVLFHHMLGGMRHLLWDLGYGFAPSNSHFLALLTIIGSLTLTAVCWAVYGFIIIGGRAMSFEKPYAQTPRARVRGLGAARSGTTLFWHQRLTAVGNILFVLGLIGLVFAMSGASYDQARAWISHPLIAIFLIAGIINVLLHMRLGMQVIVEDYIHGEKTKFALLIFNIFYCSILAISATLAILKISFGG